MKKIFLTFLLFFACVSEDTSSEASTLLQEDPCNIVCDSYSLTVTQSASFTNTDDNGDSGVGLSLDNPTEANFAYFSSVPDAETRANIQYSGFTIVSSHGNVEIKTGVNRTTRIIITNTGHIQLRLQVGSNGLLTGDNYYDANGFLKVVQ